MKKGSCEVSIAETFRREERGEKNGNHAGGLRVTLVFRCDIYLFAVSSITPARTRRCKLLKEQEKEVQRGRRENKIRGFQSFGLALKSGLGEERKKKMKSKWNQPLTWQHPVLSAKNSRFYDCMATFACLWSLYSEVLGLGYCCLQVLVHNIVMCTQHACVNLFR